jgi:hypothetical protein
MIRKIMPTLIADQIIGVQPMGNFFPPGPRLQARNDAYNAYPYIAQRGDSIWDLGIDRQDLRDMKAWLAVSVESGSWHYTNGSFYFRNEADRTMFVLKWS